LPFFLLGLLGLFGWLGLCDPLLLLAAVPAKPAAPPPPLLLLLLLPASVCGAGDGSMGQPDSSKKMTCMPAVVAARHSEHVLIILVHENIHLMPVIRLANKPAANQEHCTDNQPRCWCCASARPAAAPYAPLQSAECATSTSVNSKVQHDSKTPSHCSTVNMLSLSVAAPGKFS
jgi:hypothetical protein